MRDAVRRHAGERSRADSAAERRSRPVRISCGRCVVKQNRSELQRTLERELPHDADLFDAMRVLNERGAEWVLVTDGAEPVHAGTREALYRLEAPVRAVVNPIGCGDCMAGGIAWALEQGRDPLDAIRFGVAAAADKVGQVLPGLVDRGRVEELARAVTVTRF